MTVVKGNLEKEIDKLVELKKEYMINHSTSNYIKTIDKKIRVHRMNYFLLTNTVYKIPK